MQIKKKKTLRLKRDFKIALKKIACILVREHMFKNELPWEICEESKPLC